MTAFDEVAATTVPLFDVDSEEAGIRDASITFRHGIFLGGKCEVVKCAWKSLQEVKTRSQQSIIPGQ